MDSHMFKSRIIIPIPTCDLCTHAPRHVSRSPQPTANTPTPDDTATQPLDHRMHPTTAQCCCSAHQPSDTCSHVSSAAHATGTQHLANRPNSDKRHPWTDDMLCPWSIDVHIQSTSIPSHRQPTPRADNQHTSITAKRQQTCSMCQHAPDYPHCAVIKN